MSDRILIVARMSDESAIRVRELFAESDRTTLPFDLGVVRRDLYKYQGLYFHHIEFAGEGRPAVADARGRQDFQELSRRLDDYIAPFDPATWRSPADAMADSFYSWSAPGRSGVAGKSSS